MEKKYEEAIFAGGCFWCMVSPFKVLKGVIEIKSGYIGGHVKDPRYEDVKKQKTGHYEAVKIIYDPQELSYEKLLKAFWMQVDPTDGEGQFQDRGPQYRTGIFYTTEEQKIIAEKSKKELDESGRFPKPVITPIIPATMFYDAEEYHQDFHEKEPKLYKDDRAISGRDEFIAEYWGDEFWEMMEEE